MQFTSYFETIIDLPFLLKKNRENFPDAAMCLGMSPKSSIM